MAFVIVGRDILSSIFTGRFLMRELKAEESVEFDSVSGVIQSIDLLTAKIISKQEEIIVPNSELAKKTIKRKG